MRGASELQADIQILENLGEGDSFQPTESIVPREAVARHGGTRNAAEEACELALRAQGGMALGAEGGDGFDIGLADIGVISFRKWGGFFSPASAAVPAVGVMELYLLLQSGICRCLQFRILSTSFAL